MHSKHVHHFEKLRVTKLDGSESEITGEITLPFLVDLRKEAISSLAEHIEVPGFRPGHIPEDVLIKRVGEMRILEETAELALGRQYPHIIEEAKLNVVGRPEIAITKLAPGIPLEFKIKVALEPEFKLPDYKNIASEVNKGEDDLAVTDKEIEDVVKELTERKINPELKEGEKLEDKIKENLGEEKKYRAKEKKRISLLEKLVKDTEITVPKVLIDSELLKMLAQFRDDITKFGMKWEDYLKGLGKKEEDLRIEWMDRAKDRVKAELILAKIADEEKIEPTEEEVEHEVKHLLSHYPDADPMRVRIYTYIQLKNQKVFEFLEKA